MSRLLFDCLRGKDDFDGLGEQLGDFLLAVGVDHSRNLGEEKRRDAVRIHFAVVHAEIAVVSRLGKQMVDNAHDRRPVRLGKRRVAGGQKGHAAKGRNAGIGSGGIAGKGPRLLLSARNEVETAPDRLLHALPLLLGEQGGRYRE